MLQIALKEFKELLFSPKFLVISITSFILITLGIVNGFLTYQEDFHSAVLAEQKGLIELKDNEDYEYLFPDVARYPEKMAIFDVGTTNSISSEANTSKSNSRINTNGKFSQFPILAVFKELDLTFITTTILTLFAILFSYNSVSGEKENGTLKLILANSTRRTSVIVGKLIGGYVPLAFIFLIPLLLSVTILMFVTDLHFTGDEWLRLALIVVAHLLCLLVFFTIGLATSALSKNSFVSFILALFVWVVFVGVIPKASVQLASAIKPTMTKSELYEKRGVFWENNRNSHAKLLKAYLEKNIFTEESWKEKSREVWDSIYEESNQNYQEFAYKLYGEYDRSKKELIQTAEFISMFSPASCTSFASHSLANTGPSLLYYFQENLENYSTSFFQWAEAKHEKWEKEDNKRQRSYDITTDSDGIIILTSYSLPENNLDLTGMPVFKNNPPPIETLIDGSIAFFSVLFFYSLLFFAISYVAFLRYDVR